MKSGMREISKAQGKIEHFLDKEVPQIVGWMVIVAVVIFCGLMLAIKPAHANGWKQPERGEVEQVQNQDIYIEDNDSQHLGVDARQSTTTNNDIGVGAEATSSNDGNRQEIGISQNYKDHAVRAIIGTTSADSDPGSTAPCLESRRSISVWAVGVGGKTKLNERCWEEYQLDASHRRSQEALRLDLERAKLLHELGYPSDAARLLGVGGGDKYTPAQLEILEKEVAEYREKKVHGDLYK